MWQEIGHALGYDHTSDENNVMYPKLDTRYEYEYDETITLRDGWWKPIVFCSSGEMYYSTERVSSIGGYKIYVIPPDTSPEGVITDLEEFYTDCSAYEDTYTAFSKTCNVERGSHLMLYNPSLLFGLEGDIKIKIRDTESRRDLSTTFDSNNMYYTQEYLNYVRELFGNKKVADTYADIDEFEFRKKLEDLKIL